MDLASVFVSAMQEFVFEIVAFIPKLIVAIIIWYLGRYLIAWGIKIVKRLKFKGAKPVNKIVETFTFVIEPVGKVFLALVVLDYLGIGRTVISAVLSGLTFAIAIALGIAFGKALEPDAKDLVKEVKKQLEK